MLQTIMSYAPSAPTLCCTPLSRTLGSSPSLELLEKITLQACSGWSQRPFCVLRTFCLCPHSGCGILSLSLCPQAAIPIPRQLHLLLFQPSHFHSWHYLLHWRSCHYHHCHSRLSCHQNGSVSFYSGQHLSPDNGARISKSWKTPSSHLGV